jgi:hypothetical protein
MCKCKVCGKEEYKIDTNKFPKDFCSYKCYEEWNKFNKPPNCECAVCGKKMYLKKSKLESVKHGVTCCRKCSNILKKEYMKGNGNHQFGKIGDKNSSFKGLETVSNYGYILEYCEGHPHPHDSSNKTTRVLQHRLVIERNSKLFDNKYFEIINGQKFLKMEFDVHHINENKKDNRIENLIILTKEEHMKLHAKNRIIERDELGKITGVVKSSNIGENLE